ncbi:hypothetical protein JMJ35_002731 [Cladonia borealis]|uniref:Uncharacterized protein n=1 Tax=Cladonia borealis TaxID=184061 RepID=A0AA39V485_9LECA|nr:hypothetical protein JMJ35_002731 [Cladonia borealis]
MLDENLPTFYLRASSDGTKHNASVLLSQNGSDAKPEYFLRHPDPSLPGSKNRYAVALYDSYNPEILFGEVLLIPEWTQPTLSQEQIRLNGGVPPPPQPVLPTEFTVQLYNPDQQVLVKYHAGKWISDPYWEFEMPQESFRKPSTSALDRTQSDPTASEITPKLGFRWKKEGKLSKDYVLSLSGKSTNPDGSKRRNREPDITIALFRHFKEITIYEPNLSRVEMEDPKGLEVVLLLGAIVIREVYNSPMLETFNITEPPRRHSSSSSNSHRPPLTSNPHPNATSLPPRRTHQPSLSNPTIPTTQPSSRPPPTDPRSQWELDAETALLRKQLASEERARKKAEAAETKRVKRMLEEEERLAKEKQKEIDRETERLRKLYGNGKGQQYQSVASKPPPQRGNGNGNGFYNGGGPVTNYPPAPVQRPHSSTGLPAQPYIASNLQRPPQQGPYLSPQPQQGSGYPGPSSSSFFGGQPPPTQPPSQGRPNVVPKKSFWGLRGGGEEGARLTKQRSTVF